MKRSSNFRSSTTSPHPHHSSNTPLAPPPPPLNHRQPRFLPFVNVNNNNNFHRHNGGIQARHPQGSQLTSSSADFTPSEPITSFSQPVFTIVKPVKKPKKSFDGGSFASPNFDDNGNNGGNSFVKSSFVKNSFNDFGGNSNSGGGGFDGFDSNKNSGFKSSTVNNQFFTTKSTFAGRIFFQYSFETD